MEYSYGSSVAWYSLYIKQEYRFHMHSVVDKQKGPGQDGLWENELHK